MTYRKDQERRTIEADHVISSAPLREIVAELTPPARSNEAAQRLKYRDFLTVALIVKDRKIFNDNWLYIHDPEVKVGRIQNFKAWSPEMVPDLAMACYGLEYFCFENDGLWKMPNDALVEFAKAELVKIGLARREDITDGCVIRQPKAYPVYDDDYRANVREVQTEITERYSGLHLVGRNGMHKYNNQDHAMMTAMLTVENILKGQRIYDIWAVNQDAEYTEKHRERESVLFSGLRETPSGVGSAEERSPQAPATL